MHCYVKTREVMIKLCKVRSFIFKSTNQKIETNIQKRLEGKLSKY